MTKQERDPGLKNFLMTFYKRRLAQRKHYSLRSFARDIGVSPGRLSILLKDENIPNDKTIQKLVTALEMTKVQQKEFHSIVQKMKSQRARSKETSLVLKEQDLDIILDWVPFAILSLMETRTFIMNDLEIAQRFGVDVSRISSAITKLKDLKMISFVEGRWYPTDQRVTTTTDIPSVKIQKSHLQYINKARVTLKEVPVDVRDYSSIVFPADLKKMTEAKRLLIRFQRSLAELMQTSDASEVYCLNVQLFPLTKSQRELL